MRGLVAGCLLVGWWAAQTAQYLSVWDTPARFAAHVARYAPGKPRPLILHGALLAAQGRLSDARTVFLAAAQAAQRPHVPPYDRQQALDIVQDNLQALTVIETRVRGVAWTADVPR